MSRENVEIVREQFEAPNRRDFARPMAEWAEDIQVMSAREGDINAGTYSGREAVGEFFGGWFRAFEDIHFDVVDTRAAANSVAVAARHRAKGRQSGVEVAEDFFYEYTLREGKIVRIKFHNSWSEALEAVGLSE